MWPVAYAAVVVSWGGWSDGLCMSNSGRESAEPPLWFAGVPFSGPKRGKMYTTSAGGSCIGCGSGGNRATIGV